MLPGFLLQVVSQQVAAIDGPVVIEDIRFPAEFEFCKSIGAVTIRFEISREEQLDQLASRDGTVGSDAEQLLGCMDENLLTGVDEGDQTCVAEGDFEEIASQILINSQRIRCRREMAYESSGTSLGARGVG